MTSQQPAFTSVVLTPDRWMRNLDLTYEPFIYLGEGIFY